MPSRVTANVKMLDGKVQSYAVQLKSNGSALIDDIMKDLNVLEADYFGIQYKDKGENLMFLDPAKRIEEQLKNPPKLLFHFVVRFYPHNPSELEEHTRYLIGLQIKQDISDNLYKCERNILVYMLAAIVQSVYGNHELPQGATIDYVENLNILPKTDIEEPHQLLEEIRQKHIEMRNMTPNEADSKLLDVACKLEHYGMRYHPAKDKNGSHLKLSVSHAGVVVFQGDARKEFHSWPRIRKLAFKKNKMLLKMKNESAPAKKGDVIVFTMSSRDASKNFWRSCIEHFSFFRLEAQPKPKPKPVVFKRGSTFRYSGRTHKQLYEMKRSNTTRAQRSDFERINVKSSKNAVTNPVAASCSDGGAESSNAGAISIHDPTTAVNEEPQQAASVVELTKIEEEVATSNTAPTVDDDNDAKANGPESGEDSKDAVTADDREDWQVESGDLHSNTAKLATATAVTREEDGDEVEGNNNVVAVTHLYTNDVTNPPPLPPKSSRPSLLPATIEQQYDDEVEYANGVMLRHHMRRKNDAAAASREERCTSFTPSELGISISELRERTPSQYELLESKMIEIGLYAAPKKPPIPPTSPPFAQDQSNDDHDDDSKASGCGSGYDDVDGDTTLKSENRISKSMLEPIEMKFDDSDGNSEGDCADHFSFNRGSYSLVNRHQREGDDIVQL